MEYGFSLGNVVEKVVAGRWLAGARVEDAIRRARELNAQHIHAIINYLGEGFTDKKYVNDAASTYLQLIREIKRSGVDASISVKLTQLGLLIDKGYARQNFARIADFAGRNGIFTTLDMEEHQMIDDTISIYQSQGNRGMIYITMQAYLRRSEKDMERLVKKHARIRLVKGAYSENAKIAFQKREETSENYMKMMGYLFKNSASFMIATHDQRMIDQAMTMNRIYRRNVTFAMLNGIRSRYAAKLAAKGNRVAVYVPFGGRWVEYAFRRMREESHIVLVLRSLLGG